jgi:hypothetical protein
LLSPPPAAAAAAAAREVEGGVETGVGDDRLRSLLPPLVLLFAMDAACRSKTRVKEEKQSVPSGQYFLREGSSERFARAKKNTPSSNCGNR